MGLQGTLKKKKKQQWKVTALVTRCSLTKRQSQMGKSSFWKSPGSSATRVVWRKTQLAQIHSATRSVGWRGGRGCGGEWQWQAGSQKSIKQIYGLKAEPRPQWKARHYHLQRPKDFGALSAGEIRQLLLSVLFVCIVIPSLYPWQRGNSLVVIDLHFDPRPQNSVFGDGFM